MFTRTPSEEFLNLLVEARADQTADIFLRQTSNAAMDWLQAHKPKVARVLRERISERCFELEQQKKHAFTPRKLVVPADKASDILVRHSAWRLARREKDFALWEHLNFEQALYGAVPELATWGDDPPFELNVVKGVLLVVERPS